MSRLCLVLGDQLTASLPHIQALDKNCDWVLMAEVLEEATYVKHHKKKLVFVFSSMRHFAQELEGQGYRVRYRKLDDANNQGSLGKELELAIRELGITQVLLVKPGEYRLLQQMQGWQEELGLPVHLFNDPRFLASTEEFANWANGKKQLRMEFFYREMRRKHHVLMEAKQPVGGKWNYDASNRKKLPDSQKVPSPNGFSPDAITQQVIAMVQARFEEHFGDISPFHFAVTRQQALEVLAGFIEQRLELFGDYQDAMKQGQDWLFHSHIAHYLNNGLLLPYEAVAAAEQAYVAGQAPLNAVEGFIRQILGWREYVRGLYWYLMPGYEDMNYLGAKRELPNLYWGGKTKMNCLSEAVRNTQQNAYAHHIQRLMVLGNFALLAGLDPKQVNDWYLLVYADAYEWVELPNVSGMVLFADGGILASKPYAASGAYINKMSDYCKSCQYKVKDKLGEQACPFNYLYWQFLIQHRAKFQNNPRMAMIYRTLDKKDEAEVQQIQVQSADFFKRLDAAEEL